MTDFDQKAREIYQSLECGCPHCIRGHDQNLISKALRESFALGLDSAGDMFESAEKGWRVLGKGSWDEKRASTAGWYEHWKDVIRAEAAKVRKIKKEN